MPVNVEQSSTSTKKSEMNTNNVKDDLDRESSRVAMVIESSTDCYAKNTYGEFIEISVSDCRMLSKNNKRMSMSRIKQDFSNLPVDYSVSDNPSQTSQNFNGFSTKPIIQ